MKHFKNQRVIILLGPPGAGKGTQAELLAEKLNLYYLETSKIIEENVMKAKRGEYIKVGGEKYSLIKEKRLWKGGFLCSPPLVSFWVKNKIRELFQEKKGIIMAGSPRTVFEAQGELPLLEKLYGKENIKIVLIDIPPAETIHRNSHRRICELMRHPILWSKETSRLTRCPLDGSKLVRREGLDDPETIKTRLKQYKERTIPLLKYFKQQDLKIRKIDGSPPPDRVFKLILRVLERN